MTLITLLLRKVSQIENIKNIPMAKHTVNVFPRIQMNKHRILDSEHVTLRHLNTR